MYVDCQGTVLSKTILKKTNKVSEVSKFTLK